MASAIRQAAGADVGVGVGPIVVPDDSTSGRPYGEVHVAVNVHGRETERRLSFNGDRARVREWAADAALALLRMWLLEHEEGSKSGGMSAVVRRQI
jgi:nicotinamide-nucleotide amidase